MSNVLGGLSFLDTPDVNGVLVLTVNDAVTSVTGTANQINITGTLPSYTASLADNPIIPGIQRMRLPAGATADRPTGGDGDIRFNTTTGYPEYYTGTDWLPPGRVLQMVTNDIPAISTTSLIPGDNTVPTSAEGVELFTTSFTPLSASSRIVVSYSVSVGNSTANRTVATFVFSGTTNMGGTGTRTATSTGTTGVLYPLSNQISWSPGSTAAITISARCGATASGTTYINTHPVAVFGGALVTQYTITEIL